MKFAVKIMLVVFVFFLSTPTIVSLIEKNSDTSYFYSFSEEEQMHKEVKAEFKFDAYHFVPNFSLKTTTLILSENLSRHDNVFEEIFSPPPEFI
ncbi:MAG: hypothetical protein V4548_12795 [Bacteroidota bacterium]